MKLQYCTWIACVAKHNHYANFSWMKSLVELYVNQPEEVVNLGDTHCVWPKFSSLKFCLNFVLICVHQSKLKFKILSAWNYNVYEA